jgi:glycerophosphoryl diester phosphodiesterase
MKLIPIALMTFLLFQGCNSTNKMTDTKNIKQTTSTPAATGFDTQGHRGCRGLMPENTIPAMLHALGMGVTTLEMDISFSKDKKAFLSHEPFFNHEITTKPDGAFITESEEKKYNMYQMSYDSIIKYDAGLKPHPRFSRQQKMPAIKPLLADVFDAVKKDMMTRRRPFPFFNIETKTTPITDNIYHPAPGEFVDLLMAVIKEKQMEDFVTIQSFDFRTLQYLHKNYPAIATVMLIEEGDTNSFENQLRKLGFVANVYSPHYSLVTATLIKQCHDKNMRIIPWTVNDKNEIVRLKAMGVDGIISDYPDLF